MAAINSQRYLEWYIRVGIPVFSLPLPSGFTACKVLGQRLWKRRTGERVCLLSRTSECKTTLTLTTYSHSKYQEQLNVQRFEQIHQKEKLTGEERGQRTVRNSCWAPLLARDNRLRLFSFGSLFNCPRVPMCVKNYTISLVMTTGWGRHILMCGDLSRDYKWREL